MLCVLNVLCYPWLLRGGNRKQDSPGCALEGALCGGRTGKWVLLWSVEEEAASGRKHGRRWSRRLCSVLRLFLTHFSWWSCDFDCGLIMPVICAAIGCTNKFVKGSEIRFYRWVSSSGTAAHVAQPRSSICMYSYGGIQHKNIYSQSNFNLAPKPVSTAKAWVPLYATWTKGMLTL